MRLLDDLARADWRVAARVYGNDHATLIGLVVAWWVKSGENRTALEGGPSAGQGRRGGCDAVLLEDEEAAVVVEVEGERYLEALERIGRFFAAKRPELGKLKAGVLVSYSYEVAGRGEARHFSDVPLAGLERAAAGLTGDHPGKAVAIVALHKQYERCRLGVRSVSELYCGAVSGITAVEVSEGEVRGRGRYYPAAKGGPGEACPL
jgi:hypothetical protein